MLSNLDRIRSSPFLKVYLSSFFCLLWMGVCRCSVGWASTCGLDIQINVEASCRGSSTWKSHKATLQQSSDIYRIWEKCFTGGHTCHFLDTYSFGRSDLYQPVSLSLSICLSVWLSVLSRVHFVCVWGTWSGLPASAWGADLAVCVWVCAESCVLLHLPLFLCISLAV